MGILDRPSSGLTVADIRRLITLEVQRQTPAIPAGVLALADDDNPLIPPPTSTITDGQAIIFNASTGGWQVGSLGVIDGSVTNAQIESVSGSKITAGTLSALLTLTGRLATASTGQRVEIDSGGVRAYDSSGANTVNIPADGSTATFTGDLVTGNLQVNGGLVIDGLTNVMNKGSQLTLNEGQQDPTTAPVITYEYPDVTTYVSDSLLAQGANAFYNASGTGSQPTWTYVADGLNGSVGNASHRARIVEIKASDGSQIRQTAVDNSHSKYQTIGVVQIGSTIYELWQLGSGALRLDLYTASTMAYQSTVSVGSNNIVPSAASTAFATDGTNLFMAGISSTGALRLVKFTTSGTITFDRAATGGITTSVDAEVIGLRVNGVHLTVCIQFAGSGGDSSPTFETYNTTTAASFETGTGAAAALDAQAAMGWDGTNYWLFDGLTVGTGHMTKLSGITWTPGTDTWYIGYTWTDGGTGHTKVSPRASLNLAANVTVAGVACVYYATHPFMWGKFAIATPTFPSGVSEVDLYALNSSSVPAATALLLQAPTTYVTSNSSTGFSFIAFNASGTAASNTNTFAAGTSTIKSVGPSSATPWQIGGDGTFVLPVWATANRIAAPDTGQIGFNSDLDAFEGYNGSAWGVVGPTVVSQVLSIPATAAKTAGTLTVSITGLRVGDVVTWAGVTANSPFIFYTDPVCSTAGQITLRFFNSDGSAGHALASQTHTFIIYRQG